MTVMFGRTIDNHNADGLCAEKSCDKPPTHYFEIPIGPLTAFIVFCEDHAEAIEYWSHQQ